MIGENDEKKLDIMILVAGLVVVFLLLALIGYLYTRTLLTGDELVAQFEEALDEHDAEKMADILDATDKEMEFDEQGADAFITYMNQTSSQKKELIKHLKKQLKEDDQENSKDYFVNLVDRRSFLLFQKQVLIIQPVYYQVSTNVEDAVIKMNDEAITTADSNDFKKEIGPVMPGVYLFEAEFELEYSSDTIQTERYAPQNLLEPEDMEEVDLSMIVSHSSFFSPNSGLNEFRLFINGEDTGEVMTKGNHDFEQLPTNGTITAQLEGDFPWGTMKSEEVKVTTAFNEKIQFQADEDLEKQLKKALIQYNKSKGETVASIDADKMKNSTEGMTTSIVDIGRELKDNNQDYKAKFKGLDFYPSTFVLDSNPDEKFRFMIVTDLYVDEIVYDENEKAPDLKNYNLLTIYKVIYDEKDEEWKVDGIGDEEQVKKYYDDLHDEEVEKYRVESPKIITNEW